MKYECIVSLDRVRESLPARGAWIEIMINKRKHPAFDSRSPLGGRGLKSLEVCINPSGLWSLPARGAWIEIIHSHELQNEDAVAPRSGGVD